MKPEEAKEFVALIEEVARDLGFGRGKRDQVEPARPDVSEQR